MSDSEYPIDEKFWGDKLEVNTALLLKNYNDDSYMERWAYRMKSRARDILLQLLELDSGVKAAHARELILENKSKLVPYLLAESAVAGKRSYAITEVARSKLAPELVEFCHETEDRYDRIALAWLLFTDNPDNLELVFHLDRTQRKGFARMVLENPPQMDDVNASQFFTRDKLQAVLNEYEAEKNTKKESHCAAILKNGNGGNFQLFIKRDLKPGFVSHGEKNTFGFEREWIVLEFEPDLNRVYICSVSPDIPLEFANLFASKLFSKNVEYTNELLSTDEEKITDFLLELKMQRTDFPLVEVTFKNSGLDGSPQLRINDQRNKSIAPALGQFGATYGDPLEMVEDIESIKIYHYKKRVKMIFEKVEGSNRQYVVRYTDQPLYGEQRRAFEQEMEKVYGIKILSTEKKHNAA